jgi:hypothetical protein
MAISKNVVFWDVAPCFYCKRRLFSGTYRERIGEIVIVNVVPSLPFLVIMMMEAIWSFEMSVLARTTRRNIPEDGILHSYPRENLKS